MTALSEALPDDIDALKALILAERARHAAEIETRDQARATDQELIARLSRIIGGLQRSTFGARSEKLHPDQLALGLEDLEQEVAEAEARSASPAAKAESAAKRRANRGALPAHLARIERLIDIEEKTCPCCSGALHRIGEDVALLAQLIEASEEPGPERLHYEPASLLARSAARLCRPATGVGFDRIELLMRASASAAIGVFSGALRSSSS